MASETDLRRTIREFLTRQQIFFWHNLQGRIARRYKPYPGLPDLEGIWKTKHFYIEVKGETGKLEPAQVKFREDVRIHGQGRESVIVAYDWEGFLKQWREFTK